MKLIITALVLLLSISCSNLSMDSQFSRSIASVELDNSVELHNRLVKKISNIVIEDINREYALGVDLNDEGIKSFIATLKDKSLLTKQKIKTLALKHQDAIIFQQILRGVKYGVIYPFLLYTGNAHLIPIIGAGLLNSNSTTLLYIAIKNVIKNYSTVRKYKFTVNKLESMIARTFSDRPDIKWKKIVLTNFDGEYRLLLSINELEDLVDDKIFLRKAAFYRDVPAIYQNILIDRIKQDQESYFKLLKRSQLVTTTHSELIRLYMLRRRSIDVRATVRRQISKSINEVHELKAYKYFTKPYRQIRAVENVILERIDKQLSIINHLLYKNTSLGLRLSDYQVHRVTKKILEELNHLEAFAKDMQYKQSSLENQLVNFLSVRNLELPKYLKKSCTSAIIESYY